MNKSLLVPTKNPFLHGSSKTQNPSFKYLVPDPLLDTIVIVLPFAVVVGVAAAVEVWMPVGYDFGPFE